MALWRLPLRPRLEGTIKNSLIGTKEVLFLLCAWFAVWVQQLKIYLHQATDLDPAMPPSLRSAEISGWILGADNLQLKQHTRRSLFIWHKCFLLKAFGSPGNWSSLFPAQAQGDHIRAYGILERILGLDADPVCEEQCDKGL